MPEVQLHGVFFCSMSQSLIAFHLADKYPRGEYSRMKPMVGLFNFSSIFSSTLQYLPHFSKHQKRLHNPKLEGEIAHDFSAGH